MLELVGYVIIQNHIVYVKGVFLKRVKITMVLSFILHKQQQKTCIHQNMDLHLQALLALIGIAHPY